MARPPKYTKWLTADGLAQVEQWASEGLTFKEIAAHMDVSISTFVEWKKEFSELSVSYQKGRDVYTENAITENESMFDDRSQWKEVKDRIFEEWRDAGGNVTQRKVTEKIHMIPPSDAILIFRAKHLQPDKYGESGNAQMGDTLNEHNSIVAAIKAIKDD